jgi:hypothetical protein
VHEEGILYVVYFAFDARLVCETKHFIRNTNFRIPWQG